MAFITAKSNIKTSILNFVKNLLSKAQKIALDIILSPCCDPVITGEATCVDEEDNTYSLVFTVENPIYGATGVEVIALGTDGNSEGLIQVSTISTDGKTITVALSTPLNAGAPAVGCPEVTGYFFLITILYASGSSGQSGAYRLDTVCVDLPACDGR